MRFLHTADWHLGRSFRQASLVEDQAHVLNQLVDQAIRERVDAVVVAGDVYDRRGGDLIDINARAETNSATIHKEQVI